MLWKQYCAIFEINSYAVYLTRAWVNICCGWGIFYQHFINSAYSHGLKIYSYVNSHEIKRETVNKKRENETVIGV